jgi:hypothetical protein
MNTQPTKRQRTLEGLIHDVYDQADAIDESYAKDLSEAKLRPLARKLRDSVAKLLAMVDG